MLLQRNDLNEFKLRQRNLLYPAPVLKTHQDGFRAGGDLARHKAANSTAMLADDCCPLPACIFCALVTDGTSGALAVSPRLKDEVWTEAVSPPACIAGVWI